MKRFVLVLSLLAALVGVADDSYLYWMVDTSEVSSSLGENTTLTVTAFNNGQWSNYLTFYYDNGNQASAPDHVGHQAIKTSNLDSGGYYASLAKASGSGWSYMVEIWNGDTLLGQSQSLGYADAAQYVMTVTAGAPISTADLYKFNVAAPVPEPNSAVLLLLGCAGLALRRRRVKQA